jgi:hypothetical protein
MAAATRTSAEGKPQLSRLQKVWREVSRPFRPRSKRTSKPATAAPVNTTSLATFDVQSCTVEPEGLDLLCRLVQESAAFPGPIVEIGTLLGITATHMALAKQPSQKIITVDNYCWNPWSLPPDKHYALAHQVLYYLIQSGHVEQRRMSKDDFYASYNGPPPALVFLDAWHTYEETKKDIEWAQRVGAKFIAGHDYCDKFPGVIQIVDECGGPRSLSGSVWVLHPNDSAQARRAA